MSITFQGKPLLIWNFMFSLLNGLIQLNKIFAGKPVMFVHFVVCLFANSDGWKYCQELSSKTNLRFVCLFIKRKHIDRYFFCKPYIINKDSFSRNKSKTGHWDIAEYIFTKTFSKKQLLNRLYYIWKLTHLR